MKKCFGKKHPYIFKCHEGWRHGYQCKKVEECYQKYINHMIEEEIKR